MHPNYDDIIGRIAEPPVWWQAGGVPRWDPFTPHRSPNIYANEAVLMEIACQSCAHVFHVVMTGKKESDALSERIMDGSLHYGDPPNIDCCPGGPSMNSEPRRILEYWSRGNPRYRDGSRITDARYFDWERNPLLEGEYQGWSGSSRPAGGRAP